MEKTKLIWEDGSELYVKGSFENAEVISTKEMDNQDLLNGIYWVVPCSGTGFWYYLENLEWYRIENGNQLKFARYSTDSFWRNYAFNRESESRRINTVRST